MPFDDNDNDNLYNDNSYPTLTQNQPSTTPFGEGYTPNDAVPNLTRKVQYSSEGNDPYSQLLSAGDRLLHHSNLDYAPGKVNNYPTHAHLFVDSTRDRIFQNEVVNPATEHDNLDSSFQDNLGRQHSVYLGHNFRQRNNPGFLDEDINNTHGLHNVATPDLMQNYHQQLREMRGVSQAHQDMNLAARDPENEAPLAVNHDELQQTPALLHMMQMHHDELARRGVNMRIFDEANAWPQEQQDAMARYELERFRRRMPFANINRERPADFMRRPYGRTQ